ncbi:MAG: hypothetical protein JXA42_08430, partial [Anaerolineales bacterium]|nr:hypothetical protein [Anaerolineales bacterium]
MKWIPRTLAADIMRAFEEKDASTHIFYITGKGGEGKTILLYQIGQALGSVDGAQPSFPWSGILDLYHSDVNSNSELEQRLSHVFEMNQEFANYHAERELFEVRRDEGLSGSELESERTQLSELFAAGMNEVAAQARLVIAFDTTERLQYDADQIQKLCGLESETTTVRSWLIQQLKWWKNCVVLLVGRAGENPALGPLLAEALADLPDVHYEHRELKEFDQGEARQYFAQKKEYVPALVDLGDVFCERLRKVTDGNPIRLDLAIEVIQHQLGFDAFQKQIEEGSDEEVRQKIDQLLIEHVMNDESNIETRQILRYLMVARKGLDADLLHYLAGPEWDIDECQQRLGTIAEREFIKRYASDPQAGRLFLHDHMYGFCDAHLLQPEEVQGYCERIVAWYEEQIEAAADEKTRQDLLVDSLLYRLRADPIAGYRWYAEQVDTAIRALEVGFDMRMRNEVMAFMQSTSKIDRKLR